MMTLPNIALSVKQPWASLIVHGHKPIENRSWGTLFRGRVIIHASKKLEPREMEACRHLMMERGIQLPDSSPLKGLSLHAYPAGGIVGVVTMTDCVTASEDPWFVGTNGFVFEEATPVPFRACRGALGFFEPQFPREEPTLL